MADYEFRSIEQWPRPMTKDRRGSAFRATYLNTLKLLDKELDNLGVSCAVIQLAISQGDLRRDGSPRADARPSHPGVIVSFASKKTGPVSFPCDAFLDWKDNLRGIALTLERLRLADLYGVTRHGEQYKGWAALPPPVPQDSREQAAEWLSSVSGVVVTASNTSREAVDLAFKTALKKHHSDLGGTDEMTRRLIAARQVLQAAA